MTPPASGIWLSVKELWSGAFNVGLTGACVSIIFLIHSLSICGCGVHRAAPTISVTNVPNGCITNTATVSRSRVTSLTRSNLKTLTLSLANLHSGTLGRYVPRLHSA